MKKVILAMLVLLILTGCSSGNDRKKEQANSLKVHFINVGQADSIFITAPQGCMLIDGGNNGDAKKIIQYIREQGVEKLDYVVATHPHEDHIGGLDKVIDTFSVGKVFMPRVENNTKSFESLLRSIKKQGLKVSTAREGVTFSLDSDTQCEILSPSKQEYEDMNDYSAVIRLTYKHTSFLFAGDAGIEPEKEMLEHHEMLSADVLKVGHHGSITSTSEEFLNAVSPNFAVISVGRGNSYNHPNKETLKKLKGIELYRTDKNGTIVMISDGNQIQVEKEK